MLPKRVADVGQSEWGLVVEPHRRLGATRRATCISRPRMIFYQFILSPEPTGTDNGGSLS